MSLRQLESHLALLGLSALYAQLTPQQIGNAEEKLTSLQQQQKQRPTGNASGKRSDDAIKYQKAREDAMRMEAKLRSELEKMRGITDEASEGHRLVQKRNEQVEDEIVKYQRARVRAAPC